jgi:uncharacterized protein (DUF2267 family)
MKLTGLEVWDSSIQRTNVWLKEIMQELNSTDYRKTYLILRSVLHTLRDHLPIDDAVYLGEQLPMLIRGMYFENWNVTREPLPLRNSNDFFSAVAHSIARDGEVSNVETATRAVFRFLDRKATDGEIDDLQRVIPDILLDLWPPRLRAA